ncbi:MAG: hypothetical protein IT233_14080 [Bacteroidia bacterium]|nr:hypothetical protein [Bacteroidia bacterium]
MNRLNKESHVVEELNGIRCSVVEKSCPPARRDFLKNLLEANGYVVVIAQVPAPKPPPKPAPKPTDGTEAPAVIPGVAEVAVAPDLWNVGVTDLAFHAMLAVYERSLKTPEGKLCTISYFNQAPDMQGWYWK